MACAPILWAPFLLTLFAVPLLRVSQPKEASQEQPRLRKVPQPKQRWPVCAAIVEPRCHPALPLVVANMRARLPRMPVQVVHSTGNKEYAEQMVGTLRGYLAEDDDPSTWLSLTHMTDTDNMSSNKDYTRLLARPRFWDSVLCDKVLVFQSDSWICRDAESKLKDIIHFDYVGAPWMWKMACGGVGNGGLSLRTTAVMKNLLQHGHLNYHLVAEDMWFCSEMHRTKVGRVPTKEKAKEYLIETHIPDNADPFGIHKVWRRSKAAYMPGVPLNASTLFDVCGGLDILMAATAWSKSPASSASKGASRCDAALSYAGRELALYKDLFNEQFRDARSKNQVESYGTWL